MANPRAVFPPLARGRERRGSACGWIGRRNVFRRLPKSQLSSNNAALLFWSWYGYEQRRRTVGGVLRRDRGKDPSRQSIGHGRDQRARPGGDPQDRVPPQSLGTLTTHA